MRARAGCGRGLLAALLLAALLLAAPAPPCRRLHDHYARNKDGSLRAAREVSVLGRARDLRVAWDGSAPSRAAAALLAAALRHALRYSRVALQLAPAPLHDFCALVQLTEQHCDLFEYMENGYDNVTVSPSMAWSGWRCLPLEYCPARALRGDAWAAGARLAAAGAGVARARRGLHARPAPAARRARACRRACHWTFYENATLLQQCGFTTDKSGESRVRIYVLNDQNKVKDTLTEQISELNLKISVKFDTISRAKLLQVLQEESSFLFLDYDLWNDADDVISVTLPSPPDDGGPARLTFTQSLRVADDLVLRHVAFPVLEMLVKFSPSPADLRKVLELEATHPHLGIEDAACAWALNNTAKLGDHQSEAKQQYWIAVCLCVNDPDKDKYKKVARIAEDYYSQHPEFEFNLDFVEIDCNDEDQLNNEYLKTYLSYRWQNLLGVVSVEGAGRGVRRAAGGAAALETPLLSTAPARAPAAARAPAGHARHLAAALEHFLAEFRWKRLCLLTENTELALDLRDAFNETKNLFTYNIRLTDATPAAIEDNIRTLLHINARIIFLNTNADISEVILCTAHKLNMTDPSKYVWISREWRAGELVCEDESVQISLFTVSFWWRGGRGAAGAAGAAGSAGAPGAAGAGTALRERLDRLHGGASWPPLTAPLADSLLLLIENFKEFVTQYPNKYSDLHGDGATELLLNSGKGEIRGIVQQLKFINGTLAEPIVFVDRWQSDQHESIFQWRIKDENIETVMKTQRNVYQGSPPTDGTISCVTPTIGNDFIPICYDYVWLSSIGFIIVAALALCIAQKIRLTRLTRRDALLTAQLLAQREFVSTALKEHYVDRAALELYQDLGQGCFGRVRFGVLRAPPRPPAAVAAKQVRADRAPAHERELLREACTLAALRHPHVVRLIGVCATRGPLIVLMEYAFFGDLREYLLERRHLAEKALEINVDETDETYHVSAVSLTRLAEEVASALEYLAAHKVVHRDVRASNCLVDAQRALKLADFGMARRGGDGGDGEAEYSCRRRGLFPVLWMAPESLERGVFSPASDAWALGVLLLELVTLGARPYGAWPPLRVLRYVSAGGRPPLPPDISPDTRRILVQCWRHAPEERAAAAALAAQLRAEPRALRPALRPAAPPADEDHPVIDIELSV